VIDFHSHILHGVDDGSQCLEDSLAMARIAVEEGIETIVATPHYMAGTYTPTAEEIHRARQHGCYSIQ
jgi:protein-tyrosine phosphatase